MCDVLNFMMSALSCLGPCVAKQAGQHLLGFHSAWLSSDRSASQGFSHRRQSCDCRENMESCRRQRVAHNFWASRQLLACFRAWSDCAAQHKRKGLATQIAVARWTNAALSSAFQGWLGFVEQRRRAGAALARAVFMFQHQCLARAWRAWRAHADFSVWRREKLQEVRACCCWLSHLCIHACRGSYREAPSKKMYHVIIAAISDAAPFIEIWHASTVQ